MESGDARSSNPITLGYYDPFDVFPTLRPDIERLLPLRDLRWKYHASRPLKSINSLPLNFIEEVPKPSKSQRISTESVSNHRLREVIYARLMLVLFDSLATYRSQVRPLIKEWLKHSVFPSNSDWMIIFYESANLKAPQSSLIKKSGFEKLKLDFGPGGKEFTSLPSSCDSELAIQVLKVSGDNGGGVDIVEQVILALKSLVLNSFDKKYQQIDGSKLLVAREPLNDLISKSSLACLLRDMRILHDALELFIELSKDVDSVYASAKDQFDTAYSGSATGSNEVSYSSDEYLLLMDNFVFLPHTKISLFNLKSFIFANILSLLGSQLDQSHSSITTLSLMRSIFSKLLDHVNGLCVIFRGHWFSTYSFLLIQKHIEMPLPRVENVIDRSDSNDLSNLSNEVIGLRGELRYLQRSLFQEIGAFCGYHVDKYGDLQADIDILDSTTVPSKPAVTDPALKAALLSTTSFIQYYEDLTELVLKDYITCGRTKSVDMLSIDMALMQYRRKQYRECAEILSGSFDFFLEARWEYVGGFVLDIYVDCLEKLLPATNEELVFCYLKFLGILRKQGQEVQLGINNYTISKLAKQIGELMIKLKKQATSLESPIYYQAEKLFGINLTGPIKADQSTTLDRYYLELVLENPFPTSFRFQSVSLLMKSTEGLDHLFFSAGEIEQPRSSTQTIKLACDNFKRSALIPITVSLVFTENLQLVYTFTRKIDGGLTISPQDPDDTVINHPSIEQPTTSSFHPSFDFEADPTKLWCELRSPSSVDLSTNTVILRIHNALNVIENCKIHIDPASAGLSVLTSSQNLHVTRIEKSSDHDITLPYTNEESLSEIKIDVRVAYDVEGIPFTHILRLSVDTALMISVSVHDIFKAAYIYSKFSIGPPATMLPIKILSCDLLDKNQTYDISRAHTTQPGVVAVFDQPYTLFYRLCPKPHHVLMPNDDFKLCVKYISLRNWCAKIVDESVKNFLIENELSCFYFPIRNHLLNRVLYDTMKFASEKQIVILNKDAVISIIHQLARKYMCNQDDSLKLMSTLCDILFENPQRSGPVDAALEVQEINICVAVPLLDLLHTIELDFDRKKCYPVGEPIDFILRVCSTSRWSIQKSKVETEGHEPLSRSSTRESGTECLSTFQGVVASDENWLVSGYRKISFQVSFNADSQFETKLTLIPLSVGRLRLPRIVIRSTIDRPEGWLMEVVNENGMETVLVLSDLETLTFAI